MVKIPCFPFEVTTQKNFLASRRPARPRCRPPSSPRSLRRGMGEQISGTTWVERCWNMLKPYQSMDWWKGKSAGNLGVSHEIWGFPVNCPFNQIRWIKEWDRLVREFPTIHSLFFYPCENQTMEIDGIRSQSQHIPTASMIFDGKSTFLSQHIPDFQAEVKWPAVVPGLLRCGGSAGWGRGPFRRHERVLDGNMNLGGFQQQLIHTLMMI